VNLDPKQNQYLKLALSNKKANKKFLQGLGNTVPAGLDYTFQNTHNQVFERTNCLNCANCCKTTSPIFRMVDIDRIAKHLNVKSSAFISSYLHQDNEGDYVLNTAPCAFLDQNNYCKIYEVRPKACREYPHTNRKNMYQIMDLTYENTFVCPAVAEIVSIIKNKY